MLLIQKWFHDINDYLSDIFKIFYILLLLYGLLYIFFNLLFLHYYSLYYTRLFNYLQVK